MDNSTINYPGQHDFVVVASDGVRFNLSRTVLAITSGFFADMFTVGGASSSTQSPSKETVIAAENHVVLDSLFAISYSHPKKPKPNIVTFAQIAELIQVAEKYRMHQALDYLSSQLMTSRVQGTTVVQPFTVTHPLPTLSLSLTQGLSLPARLALREVINAAKSVWDTTSGDAELGSFMLDFRMLKKIHGMRNSRLNTYRSFIDRLLDCKCSASCAACHPFWKVDLLKSLEEGPNSAAFSAAFYKGWTCGYCDKCRQFNLHSTRTSVERFVAERAAEECTLPELR